MIELDNRILLDMNHPLHVEQVCRDLQSKGKVTLIEHIGEVGETPVSRNSGRLAAEFVFPFIRKQAVATNHFEEEVAATLDRRHEDTSRLSSEATCTYLPGGPWFYAKLYGMNSRQDEFIGGYWDEFVRKHQEDGNILQGYFIRYADPDKHIRVRFKLPEFQEETCFFRVSSMDRDAFK